VQIRFLLGPAGSGKTFRCLAEIREALAGSAVSEVEDQLPLVLVAPKQTTYELERRLLADPQIPGYTRLFILSFERLADFVFDQLRQAPPKMLDEEGRVMVLRSLLTRQRDPLKVFRASARLTGFARQLSLALREIQQRQLTPENLAEVARCLAHSPGLASKLEDLALLWSEYLAWLEAHGLQDTDTLLSSAAKRLETARNAAGSGEPRCASGVPQIAGLWVDGFADLSEQELSLLEGLLPHCQSATLTFCLEEVPARSLSWLSNWSTTRAAFEKSHTRFSAAADAETRVEVLSRDPEKGRFRAQPALQHLERYWAEPRPWIGIGTESNLGKALRLVSCVDPETEAIEAAREILRHVHAGGRYRDVMVLTRSLEPYHQVLQRVFSRYEIPFFLDRRESVSHHPLAELTRSVLRTVAGNWPHDDWFAALKTGLVPAGEAEIDRLENEALARGWKGSVWQKPLAVANDPDLTRWLQKLQRRLLPPFQKLALACAGWRNKPTGAQLAGAIREFWQALKIADRLQESAASPAAPLPAAPSSVHVTVWQQVNAWLDNVELAFPVEPLSLKEWLPILDAGLANLTIGVIPPALDQVLVGAVDRSRNPEAKVTLVLGLNDTVFPAPPAGPVLLTENDRVELERYGLSMGGTAREQLARERYLAYVACTRARQRLVLTCSRADAEGAPLNPSPFLSQVRRLFPTLGIETSPAPSDWQQPEHVSELIEPLLTAGREVAGLADLPPLAAMLERLSQYRVPAPDESLSPEIAVRLYGPALNTSVSRIEQFAACPFRFFVHSGLRAEERQLFELDVREQGSFQHDVLALFHESLCAEKKRWRDITPTEARRRVAQIASGLQASYREGLLQSSEQTRFLATVLTDSLQDFVETLVGWMRDQYRFSPVAVELPFGTEEEGSAWNLDLGHGRRLVLHGRIDRVDLHREPGAAEADCVVIDYKSSYKQLDPVLLANGLQLQLLGYLAVLRRWPNVSDLFGVERIIPAGVFYVNLRGRYESEPSRTEALGDTIQARKLAYRHTGRFDRRVLRQLDCRPGATEGDQFNYRLTNAGKVFKNCQEPVHTAEFERLLQSVETHLTSMGGKIYSGLAEVAPFRKGTLAACDQCEYQPICRIDPWTHRFRVLSAPARAQTPTSIPVGAAESTP